MSSYSDDDSGNEDSSESEVGVTIDQYEVQTQETSKREYEILNPDELINLMREMIKSMATIINLPPTILRLLLDSYSWDQELFTEAYFEQSEANLLKRIKLTPDTFQSENTEDYSALFFNPNSQNILECNICSLESGAENFRSLKCGHFFCLKCWQEYLTMSIMENSKIDRITCPSYGCDFLIDDSIVERIISLDERVRRKFYKLITNSFVIHNRSLTWCPGPDCIYAARSLSDLTGEMLKISCNYCQEIFCFNCNQIWHEPVSCKNMAKWLKKMVNDGGTSSWIIANTKECPKCKAVIEKSGGCNHMICQNVNCKYEFCWFCLGLWEPHGTDWYSCNRFNSKDSKKSRKDMNDSRAELNRSMFYINRYTNHSQSLKFEKKYKDTIQEKIKSYNYSYIDLKYIENAVEILCQCRRTLMYTYVFAYYTTPSNHTYIFEGNQSDLERATEALSELLERDIDKLNVDNPKFILQDKTSYCESRRKVLLDHVEDGNRNELWTDMYPS